MLPVISRLLSCLLPFPCLLLISLAIFAVYRLYFHPLAQIPGPKLAALSSAWLGRYVVAGRVRELPRKIHERYGPVVRVGPGEVWVSSVEGFRAVYGATSGFEKSDFYVATALNKPTGIKAWGLGVTWPDTLDLLSEFDMKRYRLQRRLIGPVYTASNVRKFEGAVDGVLDAAVKRLKSLSSEAGGTGTVDLKEWMHIIAVECLGAVVLGWSPGYIKSGSDGGTSKQSYLGWKRKSLFGLFPVVTKISMLDSGMGKRLGKWLGRFWGDVWGVTFPTPKGFRPFFTPVYQKVSKRVAAVLSTPQHAAGLTTVKGKKNKPNKTPGVREDLLNDLIQLHLTRPDAFTENYLRRMAVTNFGAGHETLCGTLTSVIAMIASYPEVQRRCFEEINNSLQNGQKERLYGFEEVSKLRYTQAAIKEAQRLWPVIGMSLSRRTPAQGCTIGGYDIQGGTIVGCSPLALHAFNEDVFGKDGLEYKPERWLTDDIERLRVMERCNLIWGGGGRTCPGRYLAEMIVFKVITTLLGEFDVEVTKMPEEEEMECYFMAMMSGVVVRFRERPR
ncbi:putative cytochrome P450 E-class, group I [Triangularia verruculosa]|uniref:Cytochrome P450 E-class, group I n=1 Tax=Triangularia verruculosa TaxID=2587418 RepID=A0AAN6XS44_9PEZI|nr:putative cytochrome P450 E-class, group I [Triangularia verruculosa]